MICAQKMRFQHFAKNDANPIGWLFEAEDTSEILKRRLRQLQIQVLQQKKSVCTRIFVLFLTELNDHVSFVWKDILQAHITSYIMLTQCALEVEKMQLQLICAFCFSYNLKNIYSIYMLWLQHTEPIQFVNFTLLLIRSIFIFSLWIGEI